jgi:hypothetical protein
LPPPADRSEYCRNARNPTGTHNRHRERKKKKITVRKLSIIRLTVVSYERCCQYVVDVHYSILYGNAPTRASNHYNLQ